ncbi:hypothetical protein MCELHM10_03841 [Paracoccaceae bacterium]
MKLQLPDQTDAVYWAVVGYSRWWLSTDAPFLKRIVRNGGRLDVATASKIMTNYNVARGFENKGSAAFSQAIQCANDRASGWPLGLQERYTFCRSLAEEWQAIKATRHHQISAATKVMWFLRPQGWTMFDSYAAKGMGVSSAEKFYAALGTNGFSAAVDQLGAVIAQSEWPSLPANKVIDFYLMQRGNFGGTDQIMDATVYLDALPTTARDTLVGLAATAQTTLGSDFLPAIARKRRNKK